MQNPESVWIPRTQFSTCRITSKYFKRAEATPKYAILVPMQELFFQSRGSLSNEAVRFLLKNAKVFPQMKDIFKKVKITLKKGESAPKGVTADSKTTNHFQNHQTTSENWNSV